jgi:hypothetical protein
MSAHIQAESLKTQSDKSNRTDRPLLCCTASVVSSALKGSPHGIPPPFSLRRWHLCWNFPVGGRGWGDLQQFEFARLNLAEKGWAVAIVGPISLPFSFVLGGGMMSWFFQAVLSLNYILSLLLSSFLFHYLIILSSWILVSSQRQVALFYLDLCSSVSTDTTICPYIFCPLTNTSFIGDQLSYIIAPTKLILLPSRRHFLVELYCFVAGPITLSKWRQKSETGTLTKTGRFSEMQQAKNYLTHSEIDSWISIFRYPSRKSS